MSAVLGPLERRADGFLHSMIDVGEIRMHVAQARPRNADGSPADGTETLADDVPLVVFMHGFPEFWWSWHEQLRALADAGYWAIAPDMRGYNETDKPGEVADYEVEKLAGDIHGLVHALGREKAIIVGHDWGGMVAWNVAELYPSLVTRLAILNVPHPEQMMRGLRQPQQLIKSWYVFFFQVPFGIPERALEADDYASLRNMFEKDGFTPAQIEPYVTAMKTPGAVTAAMNWYRAAVRRTVTLHSPVTKRIDCPVLVIWGDKDRALGIELSEPPKEWVPNARVEHIPDAPHWVQSMAPERVSELLLGFVRET